VWMPSTQALPAGSDRLVLGFDLAATFLFGLEGASSAVDGELDLFGVLVLGFVTALGGGIIRDLIIGGVPPAAFRFQRYIFAAVLGAAIAFVVFTPIAQAPTWVLIARRRRALAVCGLWREQVAAVRYQRAQRDHSRRRDRHRRRGHPRRVAQQGAGDSARRRVRLSRAPRRCCDDDRRSPWATARADDVHRGWHVLRAAAGRGLAALGSATGWRAVIEIDQTVNRVNRGQAPESLRQRASDEAPFWAGASVLGIPVAFVFCL
jgi:Glycine transporter